MEKEKRFAEIRREGARQVYEAEPFIAHIKELQQKHNLSGRALALGAGLDHQAVHRLFKGKRPSIMSCILLANYFKLNPNELLELAAWPRLGVFDVQTESAEALPVEVVEVAKDLAKISNPGLRKQVAEAIRTLLRQYILE